jgi:riboflavin synthase
MFTGIVEELGLVRRADSRLCVEAGKVGDDSGPGSSIAVNGVCLTVVERETADGSTVLCFELSPETLDRTSLGRLAAGEHVNLERPVTLLSRLGGHLVQGHVDGVGVVSSFAVEEPGRTMAVDLPPGLARYVVEKGSIAVDGVSLTVTGVDDGGRFGVSLLPYTLEATTLGEARPGDRVNIEVDMLAKYVERLLQEAT